MSKATKRTKSELVSAIKDVQGFLKDGEAYFLYERALELGAGGIGAGGIIVEIGSYCGKSTICIALGLKDSGNINARIYAIDPFGGSSEHGSIDTFPSFQKNIKEADVEAFIIPMKSSSEEANKKWDITRNIDFLWIDGGHEYEYLATDIDIWLKLVTDNGLIAVHDTSGRFHYSGAVGVRRAMREKFFARECLKDYSFANSITCARKSHSMNQKEAWERFKAYMSWWVGEVELYKKANGLGIISFFVRILLKYFKRIPKFIRRPWVLFMNESTHW